MVHHVVNGNRCIVTATAAPADEGTVLRIQVIGSGGTTEGTCFLIHQERHEQDVVHYFLTSAHLLNPEAVGERRSVSLLNEKQRSRQGCIAGRTGPRMQPEFHHGLLNRHFENPLSR
jgi:hypothetical protein